VTTAESSFATCHSRLYPVFKRYAWGELGSERPALDATVATFEALWQRLYRAPPNPFVHPERIAFRMLKLRIDQALEAPHSASRGRFALWASRARDWVLSGDDPMDELGRVVQRALETMRPRCREVFLLRRESALRFRDIAFLTGTDIKSVSALMHRAQFVLRDHVDRAGFGADARREAVDSARWRIAEFSREPELFESQEAIIERAGNPDSAIISDYIAGELSEQDAVQVAERLEREAEFRAIAEPLLVAWSAPPRSRPVSPEEIRRSWDLVCERANVPALTRQGQAS
jgi:DNA-directed RNA polymerase specialized sigma24 family protein